MNATQMEIGWTQPLPAHFNGADYVPDRDDQRLRGQILDIFQVLQSGLWLSLQDIESKTGHPQASISAQLRHLRKPRFGSFQIDRRYVANGLYQYRLVLPAPTKLKASSME